MKLATATGHRPGIAHLARRVIGVCALVLAWPCAAWAWGSIGHRVVGQVADAGLKPTAVARVSQIIGSNSLGDVANWMDQVRNLPAGQGMKAWHFESVDACDPAKVSCQGQQCAGPQIDTAIAALKSGQGDQRKALRVLVHLVGDIHQPLHTAENGGDAGGNLVIIENRKCPDIHGNTVDYNLHSYWDNWLVKAAMGPRSEKAFVAALTQISVSTAGDAETWIQESNGLARSAVHTYAGFACQVGKNRVSLGAGYDEAATAVVTDQLARAGQRLAAILNQIYP